MAAPSIMMRSLTFDSKPTVPPMNDSIVCIKSKHLEIANVMKRIRSIVRTLETSYSNTTYPQIDSITLCITIECSSSEHKAAHSAKRLFIFTILS